jgi:hypothetical protein
MGERSAFTINISFEPDRLNRYRWIVYEDGKICDTSANNFATKREAKVDADKFIDKLILIWQKKN